LIVGTLAGSIYPAIAASGDDQSGSASEALGLSGDELVEQVIEHARAARSFTGREAIDPAILEVVRQLPREAFVAPEAAPFAYLDLPLPAPHGLRESQPFIVALMTDLVALGPDDDVLILGVGGGYHAALASRLAARVYVVDLDELAVAAATERLAELGFPEIQFRAADPYDGWPEIKRQFDAIIVRLAIDRVPPMLFRQLAPGGRLVAPIGYDDYGQDLTLVSRAADQGFTTTAILPVRFMRLPGGERL
jgi:protein-L-isoaspartate(D-aspartate) O-methyltransferase